MARILIADDSKFTRLFIRRLLEAHGVRDIEEASDGEEVIAKCRVSPPSLIFLDINMPKKNGLEVLGVIHKYCPSTKIVMVTALGQESTVREAIRRGASKYITKPLSPEEIVNIIKNLIGDVSDEEAYSSSSSR